uniref:Uncharacterized protein n=1 Tax=Megaselia scalaris TaxID=36166 RepID=T1GUY8_MEGSC
MVAKEWLIYTLNTLFGVNLKTIDSLSDQFRSFHLESLLLLQHQHHLSLRHHQHGLRKRRKTTTVLTELNTLTADGLNHSGTH